MKERAPGSRPSQEELKRLAEEIRRAALGLHDLPAPQWFNKTAGLLAEGKFLRAQWYEAPYPGYYQVLEVCSDGPAGTWREVPNWAHQAGGYGWLSEEQLSDIRKRTAALDLEPTPPATPEDGQLHFALTFRTDAGEIRHDFLGSVPPNVQAIVDFVTAAIVGQLRSMPREKAMELMKAILGHRTGARLPTQ